MKIALPRSASAAAGSPSAVEVLPPAFDDAARSLLQRVSGWSRQSPPGAQEISAVAEQFMDLNRRAIRAYDAGATTNLNPDFRGTYGSANTEILPGKYTVRARTRTLEKDTPHGKAVVSAIAENVVGDDPFELEMEFGQYEKQTGPDGKPQRVFVEDEELNDAIENGWRDYCRKENFTTRKDMCFMEAMMVVERSRARDGNVLCREYPGYEFNEFRFAVRFLEEDRLQETYQGRSPADGLFGGGNPIRASIERHPEYDFPLAYWILTRHPGEFFAQPLPEDAKGKQFREQVPASQVILFSNLKTRAEQDLGMTELDAIVQPLWRNHQYDKALVVAAIASCIKPFVLEKELPTGLSMPPDQQEQFYTAIANWGQIGAASGADAAAKAQGAVTPTQTLSPGMERELPFGVKARILDPKFPIEAAHDFRNDNLRDIAVGGRVSYQDVSGDFQNLGFIAGLMCQQPKQRAMRIRQKSLTEDLRRLFKDWLRAAIMSGYFDKRGVTVLMSKLDDYVDAASFKGQQWEFVNPLVQAQTLILLQQAGHLTRQQVQDALPRGIKYNKLIQVLARENEQAEEAGVDFAADPEADSNVEEPEDANAPKASGTEKGGEARPAGGKKVARPKSRNARNRRGLLRIDPAALLAMSVNGQH